MYQLDLTKKRRNILPRDQILGSIPGYKSGQSQPRATRRVKMDKGDWVNKKDKAERADRADGPARLAKHGKSHPALWVKDPLLQRLTYARIKASLLRRARALFAKA